jgi:3-hydroxyisobutyrate dehydrogenase
MNPSSVCVTLFGLGLMGGGMARRLLGAGFPLTVYNRSAAKAAPLVAEGAKLASSARDAARDADIVLSMVADDPASRGIWLGENGALAGVVPGAILVECSTLTVGWVRELAAAAQAKGCELLDAPVTGSKVQAAAGELNFFVGGSATALEKVRPVLAAMSRSVTAIGPVGSGATLKLINNFLCGVQIASLAEAVAMIERSGIDRTKAMELLTNGGTGSPLVKLIAGRMTAADYTPNFLLRLLAKDLTYAREEGGKHALDLATGAAALHVFQRAIDAGYGEKDMAAVVEQFRHT